MAFSCCTDSTGAAAATGGGFPATDIEGAASRMDTSLAGLEPFCLAPISTSGGNFLINQSNDDAQASLTILFASSPRECQADDDASSDDPQAMITSFASYPCDCKAELTTILVKTALSAMMKKLATLRNSRLPKDGCPAAGNGA